VNIYFKILTKHCYHTN